MGLGYYLLGEVRECRLCIPSLENREVKSERRRLQRFSKDICKLVMNGYRKQVNKPRIDLLADKVAIKVDVLVALMKRIMGMVDS